VLVELSHQIAAFDKRNKEFTEPKSSLLKICISGDEKKLNIIFHDWQGSEIGDDSKYYLFWE
jgi:hypothetical protein